MSSARASKVLGCVLCRQPRMSNGLLVSASLEADKPVCDQCTELVGRVWQAARFVVVDWRWEVRTKDGERGDTTIVSPTRGYALTMQQTRRESGARLFMVTTRRRVKP